MQVPSTIVAVAYAFWLLIVFVVFWRVAGHDQNALQLSVALGIVPVALQFFLLGIDPRGLVAPAKLSLVLVLIVLLSYWSAPDNVAGWEPIFQVCNLIFVLSVATIVAGSPDRLLLAKIAVAYATIAGVVLVYVNLYGQYVWGRLSDGMQANWWGLIGLSVAVAGLGAKRMLPFGLFGIGVGAMTMYDASARGCIVGFIFAMIMLGLIGGSSLRGGRLLKALALALCTLGALIVFEPYLPDLVSSAADAVFKLDDPNRGLGTGFTGRDTIWGAAIDMWRSHPFLGAGWHHQDTLLEVGSHNSYLATLVDLGLVGLTFYVAFLAWSLVAGFALSDERTRRLVIGVLAAYIGLGFFESRAFSVGQPMSLLFDMCALYALAAHSRRSMVHPAKSAQEFAA